MLQMGHSDVGEDTVGRADYFTQPMHLSEVVHAHFQDSGFMTVINPEDGQRNTNLIVKITHGFQHLVFLAENGSDHFFRAGLAGASGNAYQGDRQSLPVSLGPVL